ncbi:hypothetical protein BO78DRAFT_417452 [Aspergillus sclerotiicarbonarius CBS 121057]|uniref:Ubiquitin-like domain-containing protein n=1 Tax=Aspergillus sclerotiicarbonarius (strain CBS 121057 / IBT 28362) TaxID=1448318 RepID=A0A319EIU9_ASPSB|nr:hypothetical protein BO78DRAFT_417452 [Aspergillus sclerotiicarbonarius CBS 121057]
MDGFQPISDFIADNHGDKAVDPRPSAPGFPWYEDPNKFTIERLPEANASTGSQGLFEEINADKIEPQTSSPTPVDDVKNQAIARLERLISEERIEREAREAREARKARRQLAIEVPTAAAAQEAGLRAKSDQVEAAEAPAEATQPPPEKKKPIRFKDAVGRKLSFPFDLCCTWQGMEELIRQAFLHIEVIGPHVVEGHYDLVGPNGDIILPQDWERVIEPDWNVTMHMWPMPENLKTPEPDPSVLQEPPPPEIPAAPGDEAIVIHEEPKQKGQPIGAKKPRSKAPDPGEFAMWMVGGNRLRLNRALKNGKKGRETGEVGQLVMNNEEDVDKTTGEESEKKPADESSPVGEAAGTQFVTSSEHTRPPGPDPTAFAMWMAGDNRLRLNRALKIGKKDSETGSRTTGNEEQEDADKTTTEKSQEQPGETR